MMHAKICQVFRFLLFAISLGAASAPNADTVYVVQIANFSCQYCYEFEAIHSSVKKEIEDAGGVWVFAPISWGSQSTWRDRVYYAARQQGSAQEAAVRSALYRGAQDLLLPFENQPQVIAWLHQETAGAGVDVTRLANDSMQAGTQESLERAIRLAVTAGATKLPAFIFVKDATPVAILSGDDKSKRPMSIKSAILAQFHELNQ